MMTNKKELENIRRKFYISLKEKIKLTNWTCTNILWITWINKNARGRKKIVEEDGD